jgi:prolyl-tRNA synthetase
MDRKNFSEWYSWILKEAELVDIRYNVKGFTVIRPWAFYELKKMYSVYEAELEARGHSPVHFPAVIPESNLKKEEEHIKGFGDEIFWVEKAGKNQLEERLALRPTSETAIFPMYALWINGRKDLPLKLYQSGTVWRYETKATRPLIRLREILWIETHCVFPAKEDAEKQIAEDAEIAKSVIGESFGIPFMLFERPQWDKFAGADSTYAADTLMPDGKVLQVWTTHMLGQNFAKPFGIKFSDNDGKEKFVWQTTCGPGMARLLAALISIYSDDKGLICPYHLSPIQAVIVPIYKGENKAKIDGYANALAESMKKAGIRAHYDTSDSTPGFKYNHWEMKGVPVRLEIGEREVDANKAVIVSRDTREKRTVETKGIEKEIEDAGKGMFERLRKAAMERQEESMGQAEDMDTLGKLLEEGKIVRVPFCSLEMDGKPCYEKIKESLKAEVRGSMFGEKEKPKGKKCMVCGNGAQHYAYVARQY